jgi:hypothetical protein
LVDSLVDEEKEKAEEGAVEDRLENPAKVCPRELLFAAS